MASHKGTRGLDIATRNTLSALDWVLQQSDTDARRPDEFTVMEYCERLKAKGTKIKRRASHERLQEMCDNGALKKRALLVNGKTMNLYSKP